MGWGGNPAQLEQPLELALEHAALIPKFSVAVKFAIFDANRLVKNFHNVHG